MKLDEDYAGKDIRTIKVYFFEIARAKKLYGGDINKIPLPHETPVETKIADAWWRAARAFILAKKWNDEWYYGLYLVWQLSDYAKSTVHMKDGTEGNSQQVVIRKLKEILGITKLKFDRIFLAIVTVPPYSGISHE